MGQFCIPSLLLFIIVSCYVGGSKGKVSINIQKAILSGHPTSGSCVASGEIYSQISRFFFIRISVLKNNSKGDCSINYIKPFQKLKHAHYQQNFSLKCNNGNNSVLIQCFTYANNERTLAHIQIVEPKITKVSQPITLRCYVDEDPNHYSVGWISKNTITRQESSNSSSPNLPLCDDTIHYLTVHSIKISDKYVCKVFIITADVQDQVNHHDQVLVTKESNERISLPPSLLSSSLFSILWNP